MSDLETMLRAQHPEEVRMWQAIKNSLRPEQQGFLSFFQFFDACPPSHELRPKRDGKRAPFHLSHFEWVPIGTPRRVDSALRETRESGGASLQSQIDDLRARVEALEGRGSVVLPQPPKTLYCVFVRGEVWTIEERAEEPKGDPEFSSAWRTRERAEEEIKLIMPPTHTFMNETIKPNSSQTKSQLFPTEVIKGTAD